MLPNEVFALECRKRYEEQGLVVDKRNGQFAHCPLPEGMGDEGLYLLWGDHQHQGLLQSRDVGRRCFWAPDVKLWLDTFPEGFFELYEIYKEFMSGEHNPCYGRTQWKNELTQEQRMSYDKPEGEGWERGQLQKTLDKKSAAVSGENHPMYGRTGEKSPNYGKTGALHPGSKPIIAIKPDGTELHFGGVSEASRELGIFPSQLSSRYLKLGKQPKGGRFKGWQFLYA
jgi:hypothetical protein